MEVSATVLVASHDVVAGFVSTSSWGRVGVVGVDAVANSAYGTTFEFRAVRSVDALKDR
jgi:hypothetical protein